MKAIVSVIGKDKSGIIAKVSTALADNIRKAILFKRYSIYCRL